MVSAVSALVLSVAPNRIVNLKNKLWCFLLDTLFYLVLQMFLTNSDYQL